MKVAVVTPYFREPLETLERCHRSVLAQTHAATHLMIADGHPQPAVDGWDVRHTRLPLAHADAGNTARGVGGALAFAEGFDAVCYLDADNWYAEDHVASLVELCSRHPLKVAISSRQIVLSTGEAYTGPDTEVAERRHVDTSCVMVTAGAAILAPVWSMIPVDMAPIGDRIFLQAVRHHRASHGWTGRKTLFYESRWERHFRAMGRTPPADAHAMDLAALHAVYSSRTMLDRLGFDPFPPRAAGADTAGPG